MSPTRLACIACLFTLVRIAAAGPVLTGIMALPEGARFCLVEEKDGEESPPEWQALGGRFNGYKLTAFDAEKEVLTLRLDDQVVHLTLREAKIEALEIPPAETSEQLQDVPNEQLHARGLHRIEKGDTLSSITQRTGISIHNIMTANKGLSPINLNIGRILSLRLGVIPPEPAPKPAESSPPQ